MLRKIDTEYSKSDRVAFHYYLGRIFLFHRRLNLVSAKNLTDFFESAVGLIVVMQGREQFKKAFDLCPHWSHGNRRSAHKLLFHAKCQADVWFPSP
jgi:hypothetical protein